MRTPARANEACGSENGELLFWTSKDGKAVVPPAVPQVRLLAPNRKLS